MASAESARAGEQVGRAERTKRFVMASSSSGPESGDAEAGQQLEATGALMSRRAAVAGAGLGAAALLCFVLTAGISGEEAPVNDTTAQEILTLREQIKLAEAKAAALPEAKVAERGLVTAQTSADQVAKLQNDYRYLTPGVAAAGGKLDADTTSSTRRNLAPHFEPSADQSVLEPWYLLASDKDVSAGIGIPMSFDSGFEWVARRPHTVTDDGTVRTTWLAIETRPAAGQTAAVLAWARADYDMTRTTFSNVETGTTVTGEALGLAVTAS